jgi:predicted nucleotidyltransferase
MKLSKNKQDLINKVVNWASNQADIEAVGLVGSYANQTARADSDIDLVLLIQQPERYLGDLDWVNQFGSVDDKGIEYYGKVTSLRVWYSNGPEVEYGIADLGWAAAPLDNGTKQVIENGMIVLFERKPILSIHLDI